MKKTLLDGRKISIFVFTFSFTYLLSFVFEGQVFYRHAEYFGYDGSKLIFIVMAVHLIGLVMCGFVVHHAKTAKKVIILSNIICVAASVSFFFSPTVLWGISLVVSSLSCGFAVSAWGHFLKNVTTGNDRMKTCADVLIFSNLLMILIDFISGYFSSFTALLLLIVTLVLAIIFACYLPSEEQEVKTQSKNDSEISIKLPLRLLCLFVVILTINSGLMYHVINPAFEHLTYLTSWYWSVPYILALVLMRNLPGKVNRSVFLYVAMSMIILAFVFFMLLDRSAISYVIVDTFMLGACGIFDLFWWSILAEIMEFGKNPAKIFGLGLGANVLGVLLGGIIGMAVTSVHLPEENTAVIALTVICVTLVILPPLNRQLVLLLKSHTYLKAFSGLEEIQKKQIITTKIPLPLTERENEVLNLILTGKSNKAIAEELFVSINTIKTHVKNIYSKFDISSRTELISEILKNQI